MTDTAKGSAPVTGASSGIGATCAKGVRPQGWTTRSRSNRKSPLPTRWPRMSRSRRAVSHVRSWVGIV